MSKEFEKWWQNKGVVGAGVSIPYDNMKRAYEAGQADRQTLIDAHNKRCDEACNNKLSCDAVDAGQPAFRCDECPRRYRIEE